MSVDDPRAWLRQGDAAVRAGNIDEAVRAYLAYAAWAEDTGFTLKATAVYRQVLSIAPARRDVRRRLVEAFATLGLLADARDQLDIVATEALEAGDVAAHAEAIARRATLT